MVCGLNTLASSAAGLAAVSLVALIIGMPILMNDIALLETEAALEHQVYMEMSNQMWSVLMDQDKEIRASASQQRHKRQCKCIVIFLLQ